MEKKVVEIQRSRWARGDHMGRGNTLLNYDETMCCLGFVCRELGYGAEQIAMVRYPSNLLRPAPDWLIGVEIEAADVNDEHGCSEEHREARLHQVFASTPVELRFVP